MKLHSLDRFSRRGTLSIYVSLHYFLLRETSIFHLLLFQVLSLLKLVLDLVRFIP